MRIGRTQKRGKAYRVDLRLRPAQRWAGTTLESLKSRLAGARQEVPLGYTGLSMTKLLQEGPFVIMGPAEIYAPGRDGLEPLPIKHEPPLQIGKAQWVREGRDAAIITFGSALHYAWKAAERLAQENISVAIVNMCSLKPLDEAAIVTAATATGVLLTVEEQSIYGGLGSAVAEVLAERSLATRFKRLGIPDCFVENVGDWTETRESIGLTADGVTRAIKELLG